MEKLTEKSKKWYDEAEKQTFDTLPEFIKKVQVEFPGYPSKENAPADFSPQDPAFFEAMKGRYKNGIVAGVLISLAAFHAASNTYGYSCNQAGVVRNIFYKAVFDEQTDFERI